LRKIVLLQYLFFSKQNTFKYLSLYKLECYEDNPDSYRDIGDKIRFLIRFIKFHQLTSAIPIAIMDSVNPR